MHILCTQCSARPFQRGHGVAPSALEPQQHFFFGSFGTPIRLALLAWPHLVGRKQRRYLSLFFFTSAGNETKAHTHSSRDPHVNTRMVCDDRAMTGSRKHTPRTHTRFNACEQTAAVINHNVQALIVGPLYSPAA